MQDTQRPLWLKASAVGVAVMLTLTGATACSSRSRSSTSQAAEETTTQNAQESEQPAEQQAQEQPENEQQTEQMAEQEPTVEEVETQESVPQTNDLEAALNEMSNGVEPQQFTGNSDDVIDLPYVNKPLLFRINYTGDGFFSVTLIDEQGETSDLLVMETSSYSGTVTNWQDYEKSARLEVQASGDWTIDVLPMNQIQRIESGQTLSGDSVVMYAADSVSKMTFNSTSDSFFSVYAVSLDKSDLLVMETSAYSGTKNWNQPQAMLIVDATGDWTVSWE